MSDSLQPHESQHTRPPCPLPTPRVYSNSCPSSRWCHPAISSSVVPFSSCPQSLPASGSFPMSQLFTWTTLHYMWKVWGKLILDLISIKKKLFFYFIYVVSIWDDWCSVNQLLESFHDVCRSNHCSVQLNTSVNKIMYALLLYESFLCFLQMLGGVHANYAFPCVY